jgi:hypothetical protein
LLRLPSPPTSEPVAEVLLRISAFCNAFRAAVFGDDNKSVSQQNRRLYLQFKADIRSTCPDFRPFAGYLKYQNPNIVDLEPPDNGASTTGACVPESPLDLIVLRQVIAEYVPSFLEAKLVLNAPFQFVQLDWMGITESRSFRSDPRHRPQVHQRVEVGFGCLLRCRG